MLKDRFVEASRSPDCAYAIDCKNGGRLLSPLRLGGIQPVPGTAATGTWEVRNGLLTPSADATFADGVLTAGSIATPIDLRGRTADFSLMWSGIIGTDVLLVSQGDYASASSVATFYTSGRMAFKVGDGTTSLTMMTPTGAYSAGAYKIVAVTNFGSGLMYLYIGGLLARSMSLGTITKISSAINANVLRVYPNAGCTGFAFYDRALTAEEVAAL